MGLYLLNIASFFYIKKQFPKEDEMYIVGKIISIKEENEYYDKYILKIIKNQKYEKTENKKIIIYVEKENEYFPGDIINVNGIFEKASNSRNYKGFNYRGYLLQNKIFGSMKSDNTEKIAEDKDTYIKILLLRLKFCNQINNIFKENIAQFLKGLLFGKIDGISDEVKENFEISNISHILAISGMHVTYVLIGIKYIVDRFINNKKISNTLLIIFLFVFYIITGSAVSCLRACLMSALSFISSSLYRKNNFYTSLIFSLLFILLLNPYNLYNIGMWLSYFGTLGIVCFYDFLKRIIKRYYSKKGIVEMQEDIGGVYQYLINIKNKISNYIFENFVLSFSAQIFIFPIMVYSFNTISFTFFVSNILVSTFVAPALIIGYITVLLSYIQIPIYKVLLLIEENIVFIILKIGEFCAKLPLSRIYVPTPKLIFIIFYYILILAIIYYFYKRKYYCLKLVLCFKFLKKEIRFVIEKVNRYINKDNIKQLINNFNYKNRAILFGICALITFCLIIVTVKKTLKIYFIDVGQGDCTVIQTPNNKNIIIDGGEGNSNKYDYGENVVVPYLLDRGILKIDYLIISHCDSDHIGGLFAVLENLRVEQILIGVQPENSEQFEKLIKISNEKKIKIKFLKAENSFKLEDDIKIDVLWPIENKMIQENVLNNNSLVFKLYYKEFSILFTGDIEEIAEKEILEKYNRKILNSTVLKVAHHGSKTSTIQEFLEKVNPKFVLIGVGKNNKFGHPSDEVLKLLNNFNIKIYRTDINGEIEIKINKKIIIKSMIDEI